MIACNGSPIDITRPLSTYFRFCRLLAGATVEFRTAGGIGFLNTSTQSTRICSDTSVSENPGATRRVNYFQTVRVALTRNIPLSEPGLVARGPVFEEIVNFFSIFALRAGAKDATTRAANAQTVFGYS